MRCGLGTVNPWSLLISVCALAILLVGRRLLAAVPWALIVLVAATVTVMVTPAVEAGVAVLGEVPAGPPTLTWPTTLSLAQWLALVPSAMALTLVTTAEGLLVARSYAEKRRYPDDANRDLLAFGVGNVAAGMSGSFSVGSSTSRTAAMDQAGSRTQLPSLVLAVGTLLLLFGTALLADIPSPAIGAIVGVAVLPLLGIPEFKELWKLDRFEFWIAAVCFLVTLFVGSIMGILVAFVLAMINMAKRAASPAIDVLASNDTPSGALLVAAPVGTSTAPGVVVVRMAAPLFFANGNVFSTAVKNAVTAVDGSQPVRHLVIDMEAVTDVDVTAAEAFEGLRDWLDSHQVELSFSRVRAEARDRLSRLDIVQDERIFGTNRDAIAALAAGAPAANDD